MANEQFPPPVEDEAFDQAITSLNAVTSDEVGSGEATEPTPKPQPESAAEALTAKASKHVTGKMTTQTTFTNAEIIEFEAVTNHSFVATMGQFQSFNIEEGQQITPEMMYEILAKIRHIQICGLMYLVVKREDPEVTFQTILEADISDESYTNVFSALSGLAPKDLRGLGRTALGGQ